MYPQYKMFIQGLTRPREAQLKILNNILKSNANTEYGKINNFMGNITLEQFKKHIPLTTYNDYSKFINEISNGKKNVLNSEKVLMFEPTGGSTKGTKLIPYTQGLQADFKRGIYPWLFDLYRNNRNLLRGNSYWAITPSGIGEYITQGGIPVGFKEDTEYFGFIGKLLKKGIITPPNINNIKDIDKLYYLTLFYLVREENLSMISVWHPSLLIILIKKLEEYWDDILNSIAIGQIHFDNSINLKPMPNRSKELNCAIKNGKIDIKKVWRNLGLISCWTDGPSEPFAEIIKSIFPNVKIQGKGLLATEGIVSIPLTGLIGTVLSYRSHYFEFVDINSGEIRNLWELEKGRNYSLVLTTSGGLYRYKLRDIINVIDYLKSVPIIKFVGKEDLIADYYGEKLNEYFVGKIIKNTIHKYHLKTDFTLFAPSNEGQFHYVLYISIKNGLNSVLIYNIETFIDNSLKSNFQYKYARHLKQIKRVEIKILDPSCNPIEQYLDYFSQKGQKIGVVKSFLFYPKTDVTKIFGF